MFDLTARCSSPSGDSASHCVDGRLDAVFEVELRKDAGVVIGDDVCAERELARDLAVNHFAADVDPVTAKVMYAVQQPLAASTLEDVMGVPAWKSLPTWFLVAEGDQAIPPDAERQFAKRMGATTIEVPSNHVAMVSHPDDVVGLIDTAAKALAVRADAAMVGS
jgi:pimeloyl-ACP methyl ester carboxylesterase